METTAAAKKWENSKRGIITGSLGCQNSPICHVKVCYDYISQASPPIDYPTKNCSRQQQGDKFFSLFVYITCYFVIDHLNVIGWLNVDHSVFQKEELWLALIYVCSNCIPFYIIYVSLARLRLRYTCGKIYNLQVCYSSSYLSLFLSWHIDKGWERNILMTYDTVRKNSNVISIIYLDRLSSQQQN